MWIPAYTTSSCVVPDSGVDAYAPWRHIHPGGEGPYIDFTFNFREQCIKLNDYDVIVVLFKVLFVICTPTTKD
jgi:hypothetical protein